METRASEKGMVSAQEVNARFESNTKPPYLLTSLNASAYADAQREFPSTHCSIELRESSSKRSDKSRRHTVTHCRLCKKMKLL